VNMYQWKIMNKV